MATPEQPPANYMSILQSLIDNELYEIAEQKIKLWRLKIEITNNKLVDVSNGTESWLNRFITQDANMLSIKDKVRKLAPIESPVLITGETGTGKELIAKALHGNREGNFVAVNCGGLPEHLVESLLFGHMQGSFTGASRNTKGDMMTAANGTLFLDELGELPLLAQAKLLRAIQSKKIRRVGSDTEESISCRIVCATNRNIKKMVTEERFRVDLYARLSTFELHLTPLRERITDIQLILESMKGGKELLDNTGDDLLSVDISLNVRSLEQYVERYNVLGELPV